MDYDVITRISDIVALKTFRKAVSQLEGEYLSSYKNRSREFDDLAQYVYGDNIRDIDWKSSARTGDLLVRRYMAQKRHLALFVCDTGYKMTGHTDKGELKDNLSVTIMGVMTRLFSELGIDYAMVCAKERKLYKTLFQNSTAGMIALIEDYKNAVHDGQIPVNELLSYASQNFRKEMIVFLITDIDGLSKLSEKAINNITFNKDLMVVCIRDAMLTDSDAFDIECSDYADSYLLESPYLRNKEREIKNKIYEDASKRLQKVGAGLVSVSCENDIVDSVLSLVQQISYR